MLTITGMWSWIKKARHPDSANISFAPQIFLENTTCYQSYFELCKEGYEKNVVVNRCINLTADCLSSIRPQILGKYSQLLYQPNAKQDLAALLHELVITLQISGNAFVHITKSATSFNLRLLRPDRIVPSVRGNVLVGYEYTFASTKQIIDVTDILHLKVHNPSEDFYGLSPIASCFQAIHIFNKLNDYQLNILYNHGRPLGALILQNNYLNNEKYKKDLKEQMQELLQHPNKILVLDGSFTWQNIGFDLDKMQLFAGKQQALKEIAYKFGVPVIMLQEEDASYTNYKQARLFFEEDTVLPLFERIIKPLIGFVELHTLTKLTCNYDPSSIPFLMDKQEHLWKHLNDINFLTINEKRKLINLPPLSSKDHLHLSPPDSKYPEAARLNADKLKSTMLK